MRFSWTNKLSEATKSYIFGVFLLSFIVGSISGGVFGIIGASMVAKQFAPLFQPGVITSLRTPKQPLANVNTSTGAPSNVIDVVSQTAPAVVSIVITKDVPKLQYNENPFFF